MMDKKLVTQYLDKMQINELLVSYFRSIDNKEFTLDVVMATFTPDACIIRPDDSVTVGQEQILEVNRKSFIRFKVTQHMTSDYHINVSGNEASLSANLFGMHVWAYDEKIPELSDKCFYAGVVLDAGLRKQESGWRIQELKYRSVWRRGDGMLEMARLIKPH